MKAVVTGAGGFIGRNLVVALERGGVEVARIDRTAADGLLDRAVAGAAAVFHLAGVNRPDRDEEFETGNVGSVQRVVDAIERAASRGSARPCVVLASSRQAEGDTPYGRSKRRAEDLIVAFANRTGTPAVIYRLPGVFGKWSRPNYNSVVATFCYNIARDLPFVISDPARHVELVHVDDVVTEFSRWLEGGPDGVVRGTVEPSFLITLGDLVLHLQQFRAMRETLAVPDLRDPFARRLFGTYMSYLPVDGLAYRLKTSVDARGALAELLKSPTFGQMFVSRTAPGVTRGNHFHDLKVEKFCVLEGDAVIRFRSVSGPERTEVRVSGTDFAVVDIPPGMTHSIENVGAGEMIVLFWASEIFDPARPDTYALKVLDA